MAEQREGGIGWCDTTWNVVRGCSMVSAGCTHCYAMKMASRFSGPGMPYEGLAANGKWTGKTRLVESALDQPLRWKRQRKIFVNSMSDLFHESLAFDDILRVFEVMQKAKHHTFLVLTKRPQRALDFVATYGLAPLSQIGGRTQSGERWPDNVWLGVSVENQDAADERIPLLLETPAAVRFLSCEPLLGPVNLSRWLEPCNCMVPVMDGAGQHHPKCAVFDKLGLHWVIAGGESGPGARPMRAEWAESLRDQCRTAGTAFFMKQMGGTRKPFASIPDALAVREFPR